MTDGSEPSARLRVRIWMLVVIVLLFPTAWVVGAALEAAAYTRLTGRHVSTWDALWIELRVMGSPR